VTSKPYGDDRAIAIMEEDFGTGGLRVASFARPGKLFTAHATLLTADVGNLRASAFERVRQGVIAMFA
jgi:mRNA interferase MazF